MQLCSLHSPLKSRPPPCCWLTRRTPLLFATRKALFAVGPLAFPSDKRSLCTKRVRLQQSQFQHNKNRCSKTITFQNRIIGNQQKFGPFSFYCLETYCSLGTKNEKKNCQQSGSFFQHFCSTISLPGTRKKINIR